MSKQPISRRKKSKVGARDLDEIIDDPQASAEEIQRLSYEDPHAALAHPNCPKELWWKLAADDPIAAMDGPAYDLMTLESPERWAQLEQTHVYEWITHFIDHWLDEKTQRLFACDCVAHVLPFYEKFVPTDKRPHQAMVAARAFAKKPTEANKKKMTAAMAALAHKSSVHEIASIQYAAEDAASFKHIFADWAAVDAANGLPPTSRKEERLWQWRRLVEYVRGKAKPLAKNETVGGWTPDWTPIVPCTDAEIMADPLATERYIRILPSSLAVLHPNCPQDLWWKIAEDFPIEAPDSPAGVLFLLEDPERWHQIQRRNARSWIALFGKQLKGFAKRMFAVECAERALPLFEKKLSRDPRPRHALQVARAFAHNQATFAERRAAAAEAEASALAASRSSAVADYAATAAANAAHVSDDSDITFVTHAAASAFGPGSVEESVWMWNRLRAYLRGEVV